MNATVREAVPEAFFLQTPRGARFALYHSANGAAQGVPLLYLHPFAEELNTTRRVVAQQARALAANGHAVLQIDLGGCGDSEGAFDQATWDDWVSDAQTGLVWLKHRTGQPPGVWAIRAGALVAVALLQACEPVPLVVFWQPALSGQQALQQFLRLGLASQWLDTEQRSSPAADALAKGQSVEIAGYVLTPAMAAALASATLTPPRPAVGARLIWLDLSPRAEAMPGPAVLRHQAAWRAAGWTLIGQAVQCPAFWQIAGLEDTPRLQQVMRAALAAATPAAEASH